MTTAFATLDDVSLRAMPTTSPAAISIDTADDLAAVEVIWRRLETEGVATPFQRFDWVNAFARAHPEQAYRVVVVRDEMQRPVLVLPLSVSRHAGCRVASIVGGRHASYAGAVMLRDWQQRLGDAAGLLRSISRAVAVDSLAFEHAPPFIDGTPNPLAQGGRPSPSSAYSLPLGPDPDASLARGMSGSARKKLRAKERKILSLGKVELFRPTERADVDRVMDEFFRLKAQRFLELGIDNPFADPAAQAFLRAACLPGERGDDPALELNTLTVDGRIVAVLGAAVDRRRYSCMFIAFETEHEVARYSPGDVLVSHTIRAQTECGRAVFDLGVGEAFYKSLFCSETDGLMNTAVAVTLRGRFMTAGFEMLTFAKRELKQNKRAMTVLKALRRITRGRRLGDQTHPV